MKRRLACIVEGHGEQQAVPILVRRIGDAFPELSFPEMTKTDVLRVSRSRLVREGELERAMELAGRRVGSGGGVLVVIDADDDAACKLGPELLQRATAARADLRIGVVLAVREYEAWLLASARSLAGQHGLPDDLEPPSSPEAIRDAKGWLSTRMTGHGYRPVLHQPKLTAVMDLEAARQAPSFDKLLRDVCRLLAP